MVAVTEANSLNEAVKLLKSPTTIEPEFNYVGQSSASSATKKTICTGTKCLEDMATEYSVASEAQEAKEAVTSVLTTTTQKPKDATSQAEKTTTFPANSDTNTKEKTNLQQRARKPAPSFFSQGMRYKLQSILRLKSDFDKSTLGKLLPSTQALTTSTISATPNSHTTSPTSSLGLRNEDENFQHEKDVSPIASSPTDEDEMNTITAMNRAATSPLLLKNEVSKEENKEKEVKVGHQDLGSSPTFGMSSTATAATTTTTSTSMISIDATNYRGSAPATTTTPPPHRDLSVDGEMLASQDQITSSDYDKSNLGILICFGVSALAAVMAVMIVILAFKCAKASTTTSFTFTKETDSKQKTTLMSAKLLYPLRQSSSHRGQFVVLTAAKNYSDHVTSRTYFHANPTTTKDTENCSSDDAAASVPLKVSPNCPCAQCQSHD